MQKKNQNQVFISSFWNFFNPRSRHNFFSWRHFYGDIFFHGDILHGDIPHSNNFHGNNLYFHDTPTNDIKFQTSKYEICFRIPLHTSNFTKCSSKPFTYSTHGDKFSEQNLLQILQNNTIVIKHPWQQNNFLDIRAQNFINKQTHTASEIYGTVHTPQHLFSSSFRIVNSYTRQLPAKKP